MSQLNIEFENISLPDQVVAAVRKTLETGGCHSGVFFIGVLNSAPDTAYILWHLIGEQPISMLVQASDLGDEDLAKAAAEDFLMKWYQRDP
ncbi:MAG: hypothetical protein ABJF10_07405 [Chthoniobacter sp.]|uniref:hypothetical protein n=1 Tax=Chthoniobacter sp. TaxID=2510640 RepID=UPI0032AD9E14